MTTSGSQLFKFSFPKNYFFELHLNYVMQFLTFFRKLLTMLENVTMCKIDGRLHFLLKKKTDAVTVLIGLSCKDAFRSTFFI